MGVYRANLRRKLLSDAKDTQNSCERPQTSGRADGKRPAGSGHEWLNPVCEVARRKKRKEMTVAHIQKYYIRQFYMPAWLGPKMHEVG